VETAQGKSLDEDPHTRTDFIAPYV
jgi:hypothetical protein